MAKSSEVASALMDAFFRCVPSNKKKRVSEAEWATALQKFHTEAIAIRKRFSLGLIGRAMATYRFQKQMLNAGFDAATVRKVVFSLVLNAFTSGA